MFRVRYPFAIFVILSLSSPWSAAQVVVNPLDGGQGDSLLRFDTAGNPLSAFDPVGLGQIESVAFDATTGNLFGLHVVSPAAEFNWFIASWAPDGTLLSNVAVDLGLSTISGDKGTDIAVNNGVIAINQFDGGSGDTLLRFDTAGNPLSSFEPVGLGLVESVAFDATTGKLYGVHVESPGADFDWFLATWAPDGTLLSNVSIDLGSPAIDSGRGTDIAVNNGIVAVNPIDGGSGDTLLRFDSVGNPLSSFESVGLGIVESVDFDAATGNLYGIHVMSPSADFDWFLATWSSDGTLISDVSIDLGSASINGDRGTDIAVNTRVPEPSSLLLMVAILVSKLLIPLNRAFRM